MKMKTNAPGSLEVVSPIGNLVIEESGLAPRLKSLEGKTIGEISDGLFRAEETFPVIRELLQQRYRTLKIIPFPELPSIHHNRNLEENLGMLSKALIEKGCDGVITGIGA